MRAMCMHMLMDLIVGVSAAEWRAMTQAMAQVGAVSMIVVVMVVACMLCATIRRMLKGYVLLLLLLLRLLWLMLLLLLLLLVVYRAARFNFHCVVHLSIHTQWPLQTNQK